MTDFPRHACNLEVGLRVEQVNALDASGILAGTGDQSETEVLEGDQSDFVLHAEDQSEIVLLVSQLLLLALSQSISLTLSAA